MICTSKVSDVCDLAKLAHRHPRDLACEYCMGPRSIQESIRALGLRYVTFLYMASENSKGRLLSIYLHFPMQIFLPWHAHMKLGEVVVSTKRMEMTGLIYPRTRALGPSNLRTLFFRVAAHSDSPSPSRLPAGCSPIEYKEPRV